MTDQQEAYRDLAVTSLVTGIVGGLMGMGCGPYGPLIGGGLGAICPSTSIVAMRAIIPRYMAYLDRIEAARSSEELERRSQELYAAMRRNNESSDTIATVERLLDSNIQMGRSESGQIVVIENPSSPQTVPVPEGTQRNGIITTSTNQQFDTATGRYMVQNPMYRPMRPPPIEMMRQREVEMVEASLPDVPTHTPEVPSATEEATEEEAVPSYKKGGLVRRTGLALVHKGELIIPKKDVPKLKQYGLRNS